MPTKEKGITAYLKFSIFTGKLRMTNILPEIRIPISLPLTISFLQEAFIPDSPNKHPILVFEWKEQLTQYTHLYTIKEIIR